MRCPREGRRGTLDVHIGRVRRHFNASGDPNPVVNAKLTPECGPDRCWRVQHENMSWHSDGSAGLAPIDALGDLQGALAARSNPARLQSRRNRSKIRGVSRLAGIRPQVLKGAALNLRWNWACVHLRSYPDLFSSKLQSSRKRVSVPFPTTWTSSGDDPTFPQR